MDGKGTFLAGAVLVAGAFAGLKWWEARSAAPLPPPDPAPGLASSSLSRPDALPGAARRSESADAGMNPASAASEVLGAADAGMNPASAASGRRQGAAGPADSLGMVRPAADYSGVARPGPMANSRPEPPLVYEGEEGPARGGTRVIRSKREWEALWNELGGHDMPVVDWTRYMGLAVFAGGRPAGTKVAVVSAKEEGGRFVLRWRAAAPAKAGAERSRPYKVILAPRSAAAPAFKEER